MIFFWLWCSSFVFRNAIKCAPTPNFDPTIDNWLSCYVRPEIEVAVCLALALECDFNTSWEDTNQVFPNRKQKTPRRRPSLKPWLRRRKSQNQASLTHVPSFVSSFGQDFEASILRRRTMIDRIELQSHLHSHKMDIDLIASNFMKIGRSLPNHPFHT